LTKNFCRQFSVLQAHFVDDISPPFWREVSRLLFRHRCYIIVIFVFGRSSDALRQTLLSKLIGKFLTFRFI